MILDTMKNLELYAGLGENFKQVAEYVKKTDLRSLAVGRHDLENGVYMNVQDYYTTKPIEEGKYEAHRKYTDIQILLEGDEMMGCANINTLTAETAYDEKDDYLLLQGEGSFVKVEKDCFVVFFPEDAHMPGVNVKPVQVRKIVVKVPVA